MNLEHFPRRDRHDRLRSPSKSGSAAVSVATLRSAHVNTELCDASRHGERLPSASIVEIYRGLSVEQRRKQESDEAYKEGIKSFHGD
jgi:hypothetical protein